MSDSNAPKSALPRLGGAGMSSSGINAATARQLARLRFLGVSFDEPLAVGQADALIDRTNDDPNYAERIKEWHARKFELHPALYSSLQVPAALSASQDPGRNFQLPARGPEEASATVHQKRQLELFGGCDFELIDSLGREQATALIRFLEARAASRLLENVNTERARRQDEPLPVTPPAPQRSRSVPWFLIAIVAVCAVGFLFIFGPLKNRPEASSASPAQAAKAAAGSSQTASSKPDAALSQVRAVKKYPALGIAGSRFNTMYVARYHELTQQHSPLLSSPNWPEKVADECASRLSPAYY